MASEEVGMGDSVAVADPPVLAPASNRSKNSNLENVEDDFGYDAGLETPFGKIEFAFEPSSVKERKDQERREKDERDAAKAAARAAKKAEREQRKRGGEGQIVIREGGSKLVPILLIFLLVAGAVALAIWLFARPGDEEDAVPAEFRNDESIAEPAAQGLVASARRRIRNAVHAGRQASRETQAEQEQKFQDLTGKK